MLYDALLDAPGMRSAAPQALWLSVGKRAGQPSVDQAFICRSMVEYARQGMKVVRLKGGDPSLFGRAAEELSACREAGIRVEIVPGVTSACAAAADLQASLTLRGVSRSVAFVTPRLARGEHEESEWLAVSLAAQTVVIYMGGAHIQSVCQRLIAGGKPALTPVCVVENASGPGARVASTLLNLARSGMPHMTGPVSMLVGDALAQAVIPNEAAIPAAHAAQLR